MNAWSSITSLSAKEIRKLQNAKLRHFIQHQVYPFSPFYRDLFNQNGIKPSHINTVQDLKHIPFISKKDFINPQDPNTYKRFILAPDKDLIRKYLPKGAALSLLAKSLYHGPQAMMDRMQREYRPVFITFTTGTTNAPVPFMYSRYDLDNLSVSGSRMVELFNIAQDERILNAFPFAPHLAFWQVFFGAVEANVFALSTGGGKVLGTEGNLTAMLRIKPSVILGVPSYIYHLVRFAKEKGQSLSFLKKVVLGAAQVTIPYKLKLEQMLKEQGAGEVNIFSTYGFTEARSAWAQCPTENHIKSHYHLYPDKEIFEVIDPQTGEVKGEGEDGELVYTSLDARASVVMRYRTGDYVVGGIRLEPCSHCGRLTLLMSSEISRLSDTKDLQLSKVKGTLVNLSHFGGVLNDVPEIDEWQIEIRKHNDDPFDSDELIIYCALRGEIDRTAFANQLKDKIIGATEIAPNDIRFLPLSEMIKRLELETANKEKRIIDLRPKG